METPPPVNLNALSALLAKSKNIMKAVEAAKPITLSEATLKQTASEAMSEPESSAPLIPRAAAGYTREQVMASNFSPAIKEAMIKSIPTQPANFRLEDMSDLDDVKMVPNKKTPITKQVVNETRNVASNSDLVTISRGELKEMINETLINFLKGSYEKNLTEAAIKKTINTLINEGKITVKKK